MSRLRLTGLAFARRICAADPTQWLAIAGVPIGLLPSQLLPCNASVWVSVVNDSRLRTRVAHYSSPGSTTELPESWGIRCVAANGYAGRPQDHPRRRVPAVNAKVSGGVWLVSSQPRSV